jgi:Tfp pilus assembly protein PilN
VRTLNLASRPFRNERLPNLLAAAALIAVLAVSAWHLFVVRDVLPDRTSSLVQTLGEREAESARLRAEEASLRALRPEGAALAEWKLVKSLVDQRMFSWSTLFSVLEETLPDGVRLQSLQPAVDEKGISLRLNATARTHEEAMQLMTRMEDRPEFDGAQPTSRITNEDGTIALQCEVSRYLPPAAKAPPAASPAPASPAPASDSGPAAEPPPVSSTQAMR